MHYDVVVSILAPRLLRGSNVPNCTWVILWVSLVGLDSCFMVFLHVRCYKIWNP